MLFMAKYFDLLSTKENVPRLYIKNKIATLAPKNWIKVLYRNTYKSYDRL